MTIVLIVVAMILGAYACLGVLFWVGACLFGGQLRQWSPLEHLQWMLWLAFFWIVLVVLVVLFADWSRRRIWA